MINFLTEKNEIDKKKFAIHESELQMHNDRPDLLTRYFKK